MSESSVQVRPEIENATIERIASRIWRRAAVRRDDRAELLTELSGELAAATEAGLGSSAVVGDDPAQTLRQWADERGLSGRGLRLGIVAPTALAGTGFGLALTLVMLYLAFGSGFDVEPYYFVFFVYAASAALAYLGALTSVWAGLRLAGDPRTGSTVRSLSWILPLGAVAATAVGVGLAWVQGFSTAPTTFATVIAAVCLVITAAAAAARCIAIRS